MKNTIYLILLNLSIFSFAQVGINTANPNPSAILDIASSDKGLYVPKYNLEVLNSTETPISNPATGLLIYNTGTTHPKGIYYWTGSEWNKLHTKGDFNEVFAVSIDMYNDPDNPLVNSTTPTNNIKNYKVLANTISGATPASVSANNGSFNLPTGKYIVHIKLDGVFNNKSEWNTSPYYIGSKSNAYYHNIGINAVFQNEQGNNISDTQYGNQLLQYDGLFGYEYNFFLDLNNTANTVFLRLYFDTLSNTLIKNTNAASHFLSPQQSGLKVTFSRIK